MPWKIVPLEVARLLDRPKDSITFGSGEGQTVDLACIAWLLVNGDDVIVVDTGPGSAALTERLHSVKLEEREPLGSQLEGRGIDPTKVKRVILTHLHWDHCYGNQTFSQAAFLVQDAEIRYGVYPSQRDQVVYEFRSGPAFFAHLPRMVALPGAVEVAPGVTAIPTPGHSPGHQSVLVETVAGRYLIAGDHLDLFENWRNKCPSGATVDLASWYRSYELVRGLGAEILPGHDLEVLEHDAYG